MTLPFFRRQQTSSRKAQAKRARLRPTQFRIEPIVPLEERAVPATFTWDGGGDGVSWNSSANWFNVTTATDDDNFPAVAGDVANLTFDWATAPTINLNQAIVIGGLVIEDTGATGDVPISLAANGGSLTFDNSGSGATINTPAADALLVNQIAADINLADSLTVTSNANANFQIAGVANGGNLLTIAGSGDTSITGVIGNGAGGLTKTGAGTLTLSGLNTYTGVTTISQGTVVANKIVVSGGNSNLGNAASAVVLGDATNQGTLSYTGASAAFTRGLTVNAGGGRVDTTTSGQTLTISTAGIALGGPGIIGGAGNTTISSTITGSGSITKNDAGTLTLANSNTFSGGFDLNAGRAVVTASTALPTNGQFGTGVITLSGGELFNNTANLTTQNNITIDGDATITFGTASSPAGSNIDWFLSGSVTYASGLSLLTINSPRTSDRDAAVRFTGDQNINTSFSVTGTLGGNATEANSVFFGAVGKNINFSANRQITVNTPTLTFGTQITTTVIAGTLVGGSSKLTIAGTTARFGLGQLAGSSGGIVLNGPSTVTTMTASDFAGGVTLQSGDLSLSGNSTGAPVTSGPVGTGVLTLSGGKLLNGAGASLTLGNAITINGDATIEQNHAANGRSYTLSGDVTFASGLAALTVNTIGNQSGNHISLSGNLNVDTSFVIQGTLTSDNNLVLGGTGKTITWAAARQMTLSNTLGTGNNIFRGALAGTGGALTVAGTTRATWGDGTTAISGSSASGVIFDGPIITASGTSTYSGGTTLNSGTLRYGASTTGSVTNGPFGTGTITLAGGTLQGTASATIANALTVTGSVTIDRNDNNATNTFSGALNVNAGGALTFRNTGNTSNSPAYTFTGATQTVNAAATFTTFRGSSNATNVSFNALTWGANAVTFKGDSTFTLSNAASAGSGNVLVGDSVGSGSIGGNLALLGANATAVQNALGTGDLAINYGGRFSYNDSFATLSNRITVNTGGSIVIGATASTVATGTTFSSGTGSELKSGAIIVNNQGNNKTLQLTSGTGAGQVTLPSAGAIFFGTNNNVGLTLAQGSGFTLTGTIAFGGTLSGGNNTIGTAASAITADRTIALNTNGTSTVNFTGLSLSGGNLTVAGSGNTGLIGLIPSAAAGSLGAITETGARTLTIAMSPTGAASLTAGSGWTGGTNVNGGTLVYGGGSLGTGTVALNGGAIRLTSGANGNVTLSQNISVGTSGGALETISTGNQPSGTYSGNLSGSANVTLRYGGAAGSSNNAHMIVSGDNSGFTGGFTLATYNGIGGVRFDSVNALGGGGNGSIVAPAGTVFGFGASGLFTAANLAKFSASSDAILGLDNAPAASIDLSPSGLNKDVALGYFGGTAALTYSGAISPYASTYRFAPTRGQINLNTASQLSGSNNLQVTAGANAPGSAGVGGSTLAITAAQNFSGSTYVGGTVLNNLVGTGQRGVTLQLDTGGSLTNSAVFTIEKGAALNVGGTNGAITSTDPAFAIRGGGILRIGDIATPANNNGSPDRINNGAAITLGNASGGGGALSMAFGSAGAVSETLKSLTLNFGDNAISTSNTAAGTLALTFNDAAGSVYTRNAGGVVNISTSAGFTTNFTNIPTANVSGTGGAAILVGAFLNNAGFASAANVVGAPTYTVQNAAASWGVGQNIDTSGAISGTTPTGNLAINSLRAVNAGTVAIGTSATDSLTIAGGMMLVAANGPTINGPGFLTSGNGRDLIINQSGGNTTIGARITGGLPLTVTNGSSSGNLHLTSSANAFTGINVFGNRILMENAGAWGNSGPIVIASSTGGILGNANNSNKTLDSGYSITIGTLGGAFMQGGTGTLIVQGALTLNGTMATSIGNGTIIPDGTVDYQGTISGAGAIAVGFGNRARYLISGSNNSNWTGGLITNAVTGAGSGHANIFGSNANSFGTGTMVLGRAANIYFDTNAAGATAFNNTIAYNSSSTLSFWGMGSGLSVSGGTAPLTLSGRVVGSGGLTFQGAATADNQVSELILSNAVSTSGTPSAYSFGNATSAQNFVNGQAGIQLGVTGFTGLTANTTTSRVEDGTGANSAALNGALGFVRFNGVNSFIPGAVGVGYLSAIRKAGGGNDGRFGYLLTGTAGGTTYAIPEGKSFVIGSLGAGTQQFGTLGVASDNAAAESATLLGGAKAAAGQLLAGFGGGDINVHANTASDNQSLNLFVRAADDTLNLGNGAAVQNVVFTPTYGDSGLASSITLMQKRTGSTTLNKIGAGTLNVQGVNYTNTDGTDARGGFTWNVNAGTLRYNNVDSGVAFAGFNVNTGGTLGGTGVIIGNVVVASGATLAPGNSIGVLGVNGSLQLSGLNDFEVTGGSSSADQVNGIAALTYGGTLKITGSGFLAGDSWDLFNFTSQTGSFANNSVFGTSGDGTNLPTLTGGLQWQFNYATGVLSVVQSLAAPTVTSIVPAIGPTTGGTLVVINGSNFVSITSVTVGATVFDNTSFTVSGTTQITLTTPAHAAGTVDVVVTNAGGTGTLGGGNDFTYAAPAIASVVVNGGPGVVLGGSTWSLAGQNSVVKQILVTFNQAVTLASDAFTVTPVPVSVTPGPGVVIVNGGAAPSSAAVTASIAATLSPSSYLVTFSGPGTHAGGGINSGVYDLTTIASKVSANSETMASNRVDTFFAMFGTINANDSLTAGTIGDGFSNAFVDPGSLFQFSDAFGSSAATPVGPPAYNVVFDSNLDGFIDPGDLFAFSDSFGIDWDF